MRNISRAQLPATVAALTPTDLLHLASALSGGLSAGIEGREALAKGMVALAAPKDAISRVLNDSEDHHAFTSRLRRLRLLEALVTPPAYAFLQAALDEALQEGAQHPVIYPTTSPSGLNLAEAAKLAGIDRSPLRRLVSHGVVSAAVAINGQLVFATDEIEAVRAAVQESAIGADAAKLLGIPACAGLQIIRSPHLRGWTNPIAQTIFPTRCLKSRLVEVRDRIVSMTEGDIAPNDWLPLTGIARSIIGHKAPWNEILDALLQGKIVARQRSHTWSGIVGLSVSPTDAAFLSQMDLADADVEITWSRATEVLAASAPRLSKIVTLKMLRTSGSVRHFRSVDIRAFARQYVSLRDLEAQFGRAFTKQAMDQAALANDPPFFCDRQRVADLLANSHSHQLA